MIYKGYGQGRNWEKNTSIVETGSKTAIFIWMFREGIYSLERELYPTCAFFSEVVLLWN